MKKLAVAFAFISVTMPLAAVTRIWNGSAGSAWSNAANWDGGVPANGDDLVFPNGATNFTSTNDLPAGLAVHSITVNMIGYRIGGNAIVLDAGGISMNTFFLVSIIFDTQDFAGITLNAPQTWTSAKHADNLHLGPLNVNGQTLTLTGGGSFTFSSLSGSGTIIENQSGDFAAAGNISSTFTGTLVIDAGTFVLNGTCGDVRVNGGTLQPGNASTGSVTFAPGATLRIQKPFNNVVHSVTGTIVLDHPNLLLNTGGPFAVGSTLVIFNNDGADPVSGTFLGYPEGAITNVAGSSAQLSYRGGTGNDVTLTVLPAPVPSTTTTLTSSDNPSISGENVTFTAAVNATAGNVEFYDGAAFLGTVALSSGGRASLTIPLLAGPHSITAAYSGSPSFAVSQATLAQSVFPPRRRATGR